MKKVIVILIAILGIGIFHFANPENCKWFPKCWFYLLTGMQCPACGTQRAIHQLVHLNFAAAFKYNPFLIISAPYLIALVNFQCIYDGNKMQKLRKFCYQNATINGYLVLLTVWWIARNIIGI